MTYRIEIAPAAEKQIKKLKKGPQPRIINAIETLGSNPRPPGTKRLSVEETWEGHEFSFNNAHILWSGRLDSNHWVVRRS